ncbi:hypothetical protein THAOC_18508, partial [Thalassiosira oceanica]
PHAKSSTVRTSWPRFASSMPARQDCTAGRPRTSLKPLKIFGWDRSLCSRDCNRGGERDDARNSSRRDVDCELMVMRCPESGSPLFVLLALSFLLRAAARGGRRSALLLVWFGLDRQTAQTDRQTDSQTDTKS